MTRSHARRDLTSAPQAAEVTATGLGYFSLALGLAELVAPRALARSLGMPGSAALLRAYGLREMAAGIGILASKDPEPWLWARFAGDGLDLGTLAAGLGGDNPRRGNVALAMAAVAGVTLADFACASILAGQASRRPQPVPDYSDRSGFPAGLAAARGIAGDFKPPRDMRIPEAMRPWTAPADGADAGDAAGRPKRQGRTRPPGTARPAPGMTAEPDGPSGAPTPSPNFSDA